MNTEDHMALAPVMKRIASGLMMMAFFTLIWAGIALGGLHCSLYATVLVIFPILAIVFVIKGIGLFKVAKHFPQPESEEDKAEGKRMGMWFGIIFGGEGLGIFIAVNVVVNIGHPELIVPAIALVVGLHFYPMARLFKRRIDYYLATWSTLVAVLAILLSLNQTLSQPAAVAFTGIGLATATSCYGLYMVYRGDKVRNKQHNQIEQQ